MLGPIEIQLGPREKEPIVFNHIRAFFATSGWSKGRREYKDQITFYCSLHPGNQSWFLLAASRVLMWQHHLQWRFRRIHSVTKECQLTSERMSEEGLEIVTLSYLILSHSKEDGSWTLRRRDSYMDSSILWPLSSVCPHAVSPMLPPYRFHFNISSPVSLPLLGNPVSLPQYIVLLLESFLVPSCKVQCSWPLLVLWAFLCLALSSERQGSVQ